MKDAFLTLGAMNAYEVPALSELIKDLIIQVRNAPRDAPQIIELDSEMRLPQGFDMYLGLEQGASTIVTYDAMTIMGIVQCRSYAEWICECAGSRCSIELIRLWS